MDEERPARSSGRAFSIRRRISRCSSIIGMPLQLIIIGMPHSIIFAISMQQFLNIFHVHATASASASSCSAWRRPAWSTPSCDFIGAMPIIGMPIPMPIVGIIAMQAWDMPIIARLPHCIIMGMPQFIIIAIISALLRNWPHVHAHRRHHLAQHAVVHRFRTAWSPSSSACPSWASSAWRHSCSSASAWHSIMAVTPVGEAGVGAMGPILGSADAPARCRCNSRAGRCMVASGETAKMFGAMTADSAAWRRNASSQPVLRRDGYSKRTYPNNPGE